MKILIIEDDISFCKLLEKFLIKNNYAVSIAFSATEARLLAQNEAFDLTWAEHQLTVTKDFSAGNVVADFLYGGFTHHVAHHLFPTVGHTYYPHITPIIKKYAAEVLPKADQVEVMMQAKNDASAKAN